MVSFRSVVGGLAISLSLGCGAAEDPDDPTTTLMVVPSSGPAFPTSSDSDALTTTLELTSTSTAPPDSTGMTGPADSTGEPPKFDIGTLPDFDMPECLQCGIVLDSQQSGVLDVFGADVFATAELQSQVVYALGTYGAGRFIAIADSALPFQELGDCPLVSWLSGGNEMPTMMWFGWTPSDGPIGWNVPGAIDAGVHLPAQYVGNPAQLLADFDIVMYLEGSGQFDGGDEPSDAEMQTVLDYIQMGGGAYVSSEFANMAGTAYMTPDDLDSVNRLMVPLGVESLQVSLNWGAADGEIDFECFPPPAG